MADLTVLINEKITLNGNDRGVFTTQTITGINGVDNRLLTIPTGSYTGLFYFDVSNLDAAVFPTSSFKYGRVTNKSNVPVKLVVQSYYNNSIETFLVDSYSSFMLSSTSVSGSSIANNNFVFNDFISVVMVEPSGSSALVEYFIATT